MFDYRPSRRVGKLHALEGGTERYRELCVVRGVRRMGFTMLATEEIAQWIQAISKPLAVSNFGAALLKWFLFGVVSTTCIWRPSFDTSIRRILSSSRGPALARAVTGLPAEARRPKPGEVRSGSVGGTAVLDRGRVWRAEKGNARWVWTFLGSFSRGIHPSLQSHWACQTRGPWWLSFWFPLKAR